MLNSVGTNMLNKLCYGIRVERTYKLQYMFRNVYVLYHQGGLRSGGGHQALPYPTICTTGLV